MPEQENELYHIVIMDWWQRWKKYTNYDSLFNNKDETQSQLENTTTVETIQDNLDNL